MEVGKTGIGLRVKRGTWDMREIIRQENSDKDNNWKRENYRYL